MGMSRLGLVSALAATQMRKQVIAWKGEGSRRRV